MTRLLTGCRPRPPSTTTTTSTSTSVAVHVCMWKAMHVLSFSIRKVLEWWGVKAEGALGPAVAGCDAHVWHNLRQKEI